MKFIDPCSECEIIDYCNESEKCLDRLDYERKLKTMAKKNYVWDNNAFNLNGKEVEITAVYKVTAKNGSEYHQFYVKGDDENIYCTKWKKFYFVKKGDKFNVTMNSYNGKPYAEWKMI